MPMLALDQNLLVQFLAQLATQLTMHRDCTHPLLTVTLLFCAPKVGGLALVSSLHPVRAIYPPCAYPFGYRLYFAA